jgi:anaerobic magnesium-protoporphyrin IX monomethyl ester cyclase
MVMKVLLVNPPRFEGVSVIREERCEVTERYSVLEPYSLLQIGALLRNEGHDVSLLDLNGFDLDYGDLEARVRGFRPDTVMFRFTPTTFDWDMRTAQVVKGLDKEVITAGICWTLRTMPKSVLGQSPELDCYVREEYEAVAPRLIYALSTGAPLKGVNGIAYRTGDEVKVTDPPVPLKDYDSLPLPAYDLLPSLEPYFVTAPAGKPFTILYTSKGCPFRCSFCTVAGTPWKMRTAGPILEELKLLKERYKLRTASFFDETFTFNRKRVEELSRRMKEEDLDIKWYCNTRAHLVDRELLDLMHSAGCRGISFGIESGSQRILDSVEKHITVDQAKNAIRWSKEAGIKTFCSFIIGLPGENWETVQETLDFVQETLPNSAQFNVAVPYPGTRLYEQVHGTAVHEELDFKRMFQDHAIVGTEKLTSTELNQAREMAYRSLYLSGRWWGSNIKHVLSEPDDFDLAMRYALKIANNYLFHGMKHAH